MSIYTRHLHRAAQQPSTDEGLYHAASLTRIRLIPSSLHSSCSRCLPAFINSLIFTMGIYQIHHRIYNPSLMSFIPMRWCLGGHYLPPENDTTAHLPLHAHFLAPESPPPPSIARSSSSLPAGRPTTTSALHVRRASTLTPDPGPRLCSASVKGVVGSQSALDGQHRTPRNSAGNLHRSSACGSSGRP